MQHCTNSSIPLASVRHSSIPSKHSYQDSFDLFGSMSADRQSTRTTPESDEEIMPHRRSSSGLDSVRKRVNKACDRCRLKKSKCDGNRPCNRCKADNAICQFGERKRHGDRNFAKGYVDQIELELTQLSLALNIAYSHLVKAQAWPGEKLEGKNGKPLTHEILEGLGVFKFIKNPEGVRFEGDPEAIERRLIDSGAPMVSRKSSDVSSDGMRFRRPGNQRRDPSYSHTQQCPLPSPANTNLATPRASFDAVSRSISPQMPAPSMSRQTSQPQAPLNPQNFHRSHYVVNTSHFPNLQNPQNAGGQMLMYPLEHAPGSTEHRSMGNGRTDSVHANPMSAPLPANFVLKLPAHKGEHKHNNGHVNLNNSQYVNHGNQQLNSQMMDHGNNNIVNSQAQAHMNTNHMNNQTGIHMNGHFNQGPGFVQGQYSIPVSQPFNNEPVWTGVQDPMLYEYDSNNNNPDSGQFSLAGPGDGLDSLPPDDMFEFGRNQG